MKKKIGTLSFIFLLSLIFNSCYTISYSVGEGGKTNEKIKEKNHYVIYGLAPIKRSDPVKIAGASKDYTVIIQHTFFDGLINALTFGIYTPTTTIVKK